MADSLDDFLDQLVVATRARHDQNVAAAREALKTLPWSDLNTAVQIMMHLRHHQSPPPAIVAIFDLAMADFFEIVTERRNAEMRAES